MNQAYTLQNADALAAEIADKRLTRGAAAALAARTFGLDLLFAYAIADWARALSTRAPAPQ